MEIQTVVRDEAGREIMGFAKLRKPSVGKGEIEVIMRTPGGQRAWVMSVGEAVDIKQQLNKALHHLSSRNAKDRQNEQKKAPNQRELMDIA